MLSFKRAFSVGLVILMLASALVLFSNSDAGPTRANPTLTNSAVTPTTGYTDTLFNFTVTYTDTDNDAPTRISVLIDNINNDMTQAGNMNASYSTGVQFFHTTYLTAGTHNYYFVVVNSQSEFAKDPATGTYSITVLSRRPGPILLNASYSPSEPDNTTGVNITVEYRHTNGTAPMFVNLNVYNETLKTNTTYNMTAIGPELGHNWTAGVEYMKFLMLDAGTYHYYFTAMDQNGTSVNLTQGGLLFLLIVDSTGPPNNLPTLTGAGISPANPSTGQSTSFWVTYTDQDGDLPRGVWLTYYPSNDNRTQISVGMTVPSGSVTRGVNCTLSINAPQNGTYDYLFETWDANGAYVSTSVSQFRVGNGTSPPPRLPYLSRGVHAPQSPTVNDTINFTVVYTDPAGTRTPHYVQLYLNDLTRDVFVPTVVNMTKGAGDLLNGTTYYTSRSLLAGNYTYYFNAIVGNYTTSYPNAYFLNLTVRGSGTPPPDNAPVLSRGGYSPSRPTAGTNITFSVTYSDRDGDAPAYVRLYTNPIQSSLPYTIHNMTVTGTSYTTGVTASVTIRLSAGNYSYYFQTASRNSSTRLPSTGISTISIGSNTPPPPQNRAPTLTNPSVSPTSPVANGTVYFSIKYTDADNDAPTYVRIHILYGGGSGYQNFSMSVPRGTYSSGVTCTYSTSFRAGTYYYYFSAASTNHSAVYPSSGVLTLVVGSSGTPNRTKLAAIATIGNGIFDVEIIDDEFTVTLKNAEKGSVEVEVDPHGIGGGVIALALDKALFDVSRPEDLVVTVDGIRIPYRFVSDPELMSGDEPFFYVVFGENGPTLYVYLPEGDIQTITAKVAEDSPPDRTWLYVLGAMIILLIIGAVVGISLLTAAQKRKIDAYYEDFDIGLRPEGVIAGKIKDEDDIDWDDLIQE
ncbi:MAG: hypothetical protein ACMUHU_01930 [Thermoplasmatota archaeon]